MNAVDVFNPAACDEARRTKALPEPTEHRISPGSPVGRGPLDPTYEADPLGARGLKHATPPQPTEKELLNASINKLQRDIFLMQADIDTAKRRLAALKTRG